MRVLKWVLGGIVVLLVAVVVAAVAIVKSLDLNQYRELIAERIEATTGRKPGKKEKRDLKEDIAHELLPLAFSRVVRVSVWIDPVGRRHLFSVPGLPGVAGALVSDEAELIFSSNRAADTIGIFAPGPNPTVRTFDVGVRPNGLAYDHRRQLVLAANVGDPAVPGSHTLSMIDLAKGGQRTEIAVRGRTRWAVYAPEKDLFFVNIMEPSEIVVVDPRPAVLLGGPTSTADPVEPVREVVGEADQKGLGRRDAVLGEREDGVLLGVGGHHVGVVALGVGRGEVTPQL